VKYLNKKERLKLIGFNDWKLRLISIPIFAFFFPLLVFHLNPIDTPYIFLAFFFISVLHIMGYWHVERWIVIYIRKKYIDLKDYQKRIIIQSIVVLISTLILCFISEFSEFCFGYSSEHFKTPFFNKFMASLITTVIIISIYEGVYAFELFKKGLVENKELQRKNTQAQLESLKNQVNPHFLFNSLNTLISVIPEDPEVAVRFTEKLSQVYRYILEIRDKELITIREEMKCIEAYEYLFSIRFGNNVRFNYENIDLNQHKFIVPLSLQMLIENAIKHNIVSQTKPLKITIKIEEDSIKVSNNLQLKTVRESSTKLGLSNIKKRYQILAKKEIIILQTADSFSVEIPILTISEVK